MSAENADSVTAPAPREVQAILMMAGVTLTALIGLDHPETMEVIGPDVMALADKAVKNAGGIGATMRAMDRWSMMLGWPPVWSDHVYEELGEL